MELFVLYASYTVRGAKDYWMPVVTTGQMPCGQAYYHVLLRCIKEWGLVRQQHFDTGSHVAALEQLAALSV